MKKFLLFVIALLAFDAAFACTSAILSGKVTKSGRPMIWKHRDTGAEDNFVARVDASDGKYGFVALFNGGDSLLQEAWMGMNDAGFAIMNTASYNLMPDTASYKDREGYVMRAALESCKTLKDFENMLSTMPKPLGVQANFGVMDAEGNAAYYETDDYGFKPYMLSEEESGVIYRTNFSVSGKPDAGMGYIREQTARHHIAPRAEARDIDPELFTEQISRSYYHSLVGRDFYESGDRWIVDQDFVPRMSSSASIVIEGMLPGETPDAMTMWTVVGYPPVSHVKAVTVNNVPVELTPTEAGFKSAYCNETLERKYNVFSIKRGSGKRYLDLDAVKKIEPEQRRLSKEAYAEHRKIRDSKKK